MSRQASSEVLIVGLGHIGASLASRLAHNGVKVWGWDQDKRALTYCVRRGWVVAVDRISRPELVKLCIIAVPEDAVLKNAHDTGQRGVNNILASLAKGTVVTDLFSSKGKATRTLASQCRILGLEHVWSHPLAGREGRGAASADADIFDNAVVLIDSKGKATARNAVGRFWRSVGCRTEFSTIGAHQMSLGRGSHLMHVLAYAVTCVVSRGGRVSPSVSSATRVAKSNPNAWTEILLSNDQEVLRAANLFQKELKKICALIRSGKTSALRDYLSQAQRLRIKMEPK